MKFSRFSHAVINKLGSQPGNEEEEEGREGTQKFYDSPFPFGRKGNKQESAIGNGRERETATLRFGVREEDRRRRRSGRRAERREVPLSSHFAVVVDVFSAESAAAKNGGLIGGPLSFWKEGRGLSEHLRDRDLGHFEPVAKT